MIGFELALEVFLWSGTIDGVTDTAITVKLVGGVEIGHRVTDLDFVIFLEGDEDTERCIIFVTEIGDNTFMFMQEHFRIIEVTGFGFE